MSDPLLFQADFDLWRTGAKSKSGLGITLDVHGIGREITSIMLGDADVTNEFLDYFMDNWEDYQ